MKSLKYMFCALGACFLLAGNPAFAETPVPPITGNTLWHWLGIPQGRNKIKDARINKSGDNPAKERVPPLKRIADPENLESPNPAIKAAAKIKAEEDLAPQKIKAIKYLATVGCGCYKGVRDALLEALDDCTEEVRYQAAIALCQVAGNPCKNCDKTGCCNAEVMNKLNEMAYGQDAKGCFVESSPRVRAAATNALNACKRKNPTAPMQPIPVKEKELPVESTQPGTKELPTEPSAPGPVPTPAPVPSGNRRDGLPSNLHLTGFTQEGGVAEASDSSPKGVSDASDAKVATIAEQVALLRRGGRRGYVPCPPQPCPPQPCPQQTGPVTPPSEVKPGETPPATTGEQTPAESLAGDVPPTNALASDFGATSGPLSSSPNMIGDFFGGAGIGFYSDGVYLGTAPLPGNQVPRFKMAENTSPMPEDRVYFDFSSYSNVPLTDTASSVNAYSAGFEKTFFDGRMSFELRAPMATTLDNDITFGAGPTSTQTGQFGDLAFVFKSLLMKREKFALSGGMAVTVPTAQNTQIFLNRQSPSPTYLIENQSVHLMPFFGGLWTPNDRWFGIGYIQVDVDATGDPITAINPFSTPTPVGLGRYNDTTFLFADIGLGYWARRSNDPDRLCTGLAYVCEFHLNQSLQGQQVLESNSFQVGTPADNLSFTDLTVGVHLELCKMTTITAAYCTPLTSDGDKQFDSQFRLLFNRRF